MTEILADIKPFVRPTWKPVTSNVDGSLSASKFSGRPWLAAEESWPECQNCGNPMQFFVQLNLDGLPEPLAGEFGSGLLQMFYCTNQDPACEIDCEAYCAFAKSVLLRVVKTTGQSHEAEIPSLEYHFPAKTIVGWQAMEDYPNYEEGQMLGVQLTDEEWDEWCDEDYPRSGDKLAGWPFWVQGVEYPSCPICQQTMRLVFQIDSEVNIPYMWGDSGCGHITQCKEHKDQLAFGWACC